MNRKLLILTIVFSCKHFQPADPVLSERILLNESDVGFISREFFQIKVDIPVTSREVSGEEKRKECKKRALIERERLTLPYLIDTQRGHYERGEGFAAFDASKDGAKRRERIRSLDQNTGNPPVSILGDDPVSRNSRQSQTLSMNDSSPNPLQSSTNQSKDPLDVKANPQTDIPIEYSQAFAWFFESSFIYKEDYSVRGRCSFLFRNIQPKLYERVETTEVLIKKWNSNEPIKANSKNLPNP
ncbi:MAG: hypothetical protein O9301_02285 [Leptospira sp.]|nr:hypothetical protein [Leptospira sp.]